MFDKDFNISDDEIYIIPAEPKPVKIAFEKSMRCEIEECEYYEEEKDILLKEIRNLLLENKIKTQQYRSEKGKCIRNKNLSEVRRFLERYGITNIDEKMRLIHLIHKVKAYRTFPTSILDTNTPFGIIKLEEEKI